MVGVKTCLEGGARQGKTQTYQMRIFQLLQHLDIIQLDVQELVDGFEGAFDGDVVFELDGDLVVDEGFEEAVGVVGGLAWGFGRVG